MKTRLLLLIALPLFISCQKDKTEIEPENLLQPLSSVEPQYFELGLTSDTILIGKAGTKIFFKRQRFELDEADSVNLVLKEFYSFKDIVVNNIPTVTDKGDLLETNGVIFYEFRTNDGQTVELKENERTPVVFPSNRILGNQIFYGVVDEYNSIEWQEDDDTRIVFDLPDIEKNLHYRVTGYYIEKEIPIDSLDYYIEHRNQLWAIHNDFYESMSDLLSDNSVLLNRYGWINIGIFLYNIDIKEKLSFSVEIKNKEDVFFFHSFILYDDLNSMLKYYSNTKKVIDFKEVPIYGNTYVLIVSKKENKIFADKIRLDTAKKKYEVKLSPVSEKELSRLIDGD